jgi:hypothetical protein
MDRQDTCTSRTTVRIINSAAVTLGTAYTLRVKHAIHGTIQYYQD